MDRERAEWREGWVYTGDKGNAAKEHSSPPIKVLDHSNIFIM